MACRKCEMLHWRDTGINYTGDFWQVNNQPKNCKYSLHLLTLGPSRGGATSRFSHHHQKQQRQVLCREHPCYHHHELATRRVQHGKMGGGKSRSTTETNALSTPWHALAPYSAYNVPLFLTALSSVQTNPHPLLGGSARLPKCSAVCTFPKNGSVL